MLLSSGPQLTKDIAPGSASSNPINGAAFQNQLYFTAFDGVHGNEIWKSDGTAQGTTLLRDIHPTGGSGTAWQTELNGILYFASDDGANGTEFWKTDGTETGTALVKDINPGVVGSSPADLVTLNNSIYFSADDGAGRAIWKSDGTATGTVKLFSGAQIVSWMGSLVPANGRLFFYANDVANGWELWSSDGTTSGTTMVKNIGPSDSIVQPTSTTPVSFNGLVYFAATDGVHGAELWKSDGTASGTAMVRDIVPGSASGLLNADPKLTVVGQALYFRATNSATGVELWKTDGTEQSTTLVRDINPGATGSSPDAFTAAENLLYFLANDGTHGVELWRSDGTSAGTSITRDIVAGSGSSMMWFRRAAFHDKLYFSARDGVHGEELWQTDGSQEGTVLVADIFPGGPNSVTGPVGLFKVVGDVLFLAARNPTSGVELWTYSLVDSTPPQLISARYNVDARSIDLMFNEPVSQPVDIVDFVVQYFSDGTVLPGALTGATYPDSMTVRLTLDSAVGDDANYTLQIPAAGISDLVGNPIAPTAFSTAAEPENDFYLLGADATRDRIVDTDDFNLLAGNFGSSGRLFSEGNLDYIGEVDSVDLNILIAQFGKRLAAPMAAIPIPALFSLGKLDPPCDDELVA